MAEPGLAGGGGGFLPRPFASLISLVLLRRARVQLQRMHQARLELRCEEVVHLLVSLHLRLALEGGCDDLEPWKQSVW